MSIIEEEIITMQDFFSVSKDIYKDFDEYSKKKGTGYDLLNYPIFNEKLEGLESGLYLFAAESNAGKSALMMNLLMAYCRNEKNKLYGIYYSLDDSKNEIIPRVIASDKLIPISVVSKPNRYQEKIDNGEENSSIYQEWLIKRQEGLNQLINVDSSKFMIIDPDCEYGNQKINSIEKIREHIKKVQLYIKSKDENANVIVAIDSLSDLKFSTKTFRSAKEKNDESAREIKSIAKALDVPIFGSVHLRKLNANRRPELDDLKESGEWVYEASVTFLIHNDVSKNKEAAKIFFIDDSKRTMPIIEIDWAKNKKSSFKGRTFCYFTPDYSKTIECNKVTTDRFNKMIYEL